jgi:sigma-E factor negative regulatory protein RseB
MRMRDTANPKMKYAGRIALFWALGGLGVAAAETTTPAGAASSAPVTAIRGKHPQRSVSDWLIRMHEASRLRSYIGTFVVLSNSGSMSSARSWHACEGDQQIERVESLTGAPRSVFRRNDEVVTFLPESRVVRTEKRESSGLFPNLLKANDSSIPQYYEARPLGTERVAGFEADVVQLAPKDNLRFGYRIWSEKKSGLVIKLQTVDEQGKVLEQVAFSELQLDAPVRASNLNQMMSATEGWRIEKPDTVKTTADAEGWHLRSPVAGFQSVNCYRRPGAGMSVPEGTMQWVFSDGLAAVSLFVEPYDRQRHVHEGRSASGATQTLTRRIGDWWLTAVGEVPQQTLNTFAQSLERRK